MLTTLSIVAPVFGVLLVGYVVMRSGYMAEGADRIIAQFGYRVVMPVFLFRAMVDAEPMAEPPLLPLLAYVLAMLATWMLAAIVGWAVLRRPAEDGAAIGMAACFGNSVMLGIPLAVSAFGEAAAGPAAILVSLDTPLLWLMATLHIGWAGRGGGLSLGLLRGLVGDLLRNPIILAVLLGTLWRFAGPPLPDMLDRLTRMLAAAALPVSLLALGMSLARFRIVGEVRTILAICLLKMLAYPALAYLVVVHLLHVPMPWAGIVIMFASMPVGQNAFIFAAKHDRLVGSVSAAIGLSTAIAVASSSLVLYLIGLAGL